MTLTIILPEDLEKRLKREATAHDLSLEEYALGLLDNALEQIESPTLETVVANIKAIPPNPNSIRAATGSLAEALQSGPTDLDFDLEQWSREWDSVESEMNQATRSNDEAEGRG